MTSEPRHPSRGMRHLCLVALLLGAGFFHGAQAQSLDCNSAMTQMALNACAAREFETADVDLNAAYGQARAAMRRLDKELSEDGGAERALRDAQRAWISYRDTACLAEGFMMRGGSAEPLVIFGCKTRLTQQRAVDLWSVAAGLDG